MVKQRNDRLWRSKVYSGISLRAGALLCGLVIGAFSSADEASAGSAQPNAKVTFEPCQQAKHGTAFYGAQCTQIQLPANDTSPAATLNVLRARARSEPSDDPLVVITGGPGTAAVGLAWQYLRFFHKVQAERDILFIDQRGTGKSQPFDCPAANELDQNLPGTQLVAEMNRALAECAQNYGQSPGALEAITTRQAALDIEAVRRQLGYRQVNLWGSSYGTRVAMEYQHLFPTTSRTVTLDGVAPGAIALPHYAEYDAAHALQHLFETCAQQPACHKTFDNLAVKWRDTIARLTHAPSKVKLAHPRTQETLEITITAPLLANWARFALYSRELAALLPMAINAAYQGDYHPLSNLAQIASDSVSEGMSYGMHAAILCAEDRHAPKVTRAGAGNLPNLPFSELNDLSAACRAMPLPDHAAINSLFTPITSAIPTLALSGQFDPVTPPFWADWAISKLSHAKHIVVAGGHHGVTGLGCLPNLIAEFIDAANFSELDTTCVQQIKATAFFIDGAGPDLLAPSTSSAATDKDPARD
ncbi:MAG TPA: alpha/beta hydrolase [Marinagarivorans sp.]